MIENIYEDGLIVHEKIKAYIEEHPGVSYKAAWTALMREEEAAEIEACKEFKRRVPVYQGEFQIKRYSDAARMVAKHDDTMVEAYAYGDGNDPGLAMRQGAIWREAKRRTANGRMKMADAVLQILQNDREISQKIAGDWLSLTAKDAVNNENMGSSMDRAFPVAFAAVSRVHPEVAQQYSTGRATTLSMRTIFRQWFRD